MGRSEQEIMDWVLNTVRADKQAVVMAGSRANPEISKDHYPDYAITCFVEKVKPFYKNMAWTKDRFGKPAIVQLPQLNPHPLLLPGR